MTTTLTVQDLVSRRVDIDEQIDRLSGEKQQINARLAELGLGKHDAGDWTVSVSVSKRLDTAAIEQRFPVTQYPHLYKAAVDTAAIRENFSPIELEKFEISSKPSVTVK